MVLMERRLHWMPPVRNATAAPEFFSEERAWAHMQALAGDLPDRQISMPQLRLAHDYVEAQGRLLQQLAAARGGDVEVQVYRENVTGSVAMDFGGVAFTNAYNSLTNIIVTITPAGTAGRPGLLIASHHDSAVASPGASDDVAMVAVMLEAARALLSRPPASLPAVPLVLLFDGGEESICQAGHGFFNASAHARGLGAFINLEAMGAGGLPILFQHTGAWTVAAWAAGAPNAHGARIAQDIFDTGLIPGDTDYRMFSARHFGSLPGLDIAFIRDSVAYHSSLDSVDRVRRGSLQDMGEALLGGLMSVAAALAADTEGKLRTRESIQERAVYFDLIGGGMVHYTDTTARLLHTAPLALFIMLPLASVAGGQTAAGVMQRMAGAAVRALSAFVGALVAPALLGIARVLLTGVSMAWFAHHWLAYLIYLPIAAAFALRPWMRLRDEAMRLRPGQQGHYVACQVYGVGLLLSALSAGLCLAGLQGFSQIFAMGGMLGFAVGSVLDNGAPTLTPLSAAGVLAVSTVPLAAMGAILGTFLDVMMERMALTGHHSTLLADGLIGVLTGSAALGYSCCCLLPLMGYALGGLLGNGPTVFADPDTHTGAAAPKKGAAAKKAAAPEGREWSSRKAVLGLLVATSLGATVWVSTAGPGSGLAPYDEANPRRVTITHLHETGSWLPQDDEFPASAARAVGAAVSASLLHPRAAASAAQVQEPPPSPEEERRELSPLVSPPPRVTAKWAMGITDSNPWEQILAALPGAAATANATSAPRGSSSLLDTAPLTLPYVKPGSAVRHGEAAAAPYEFASFHPLDRLLGKLVLAAEPAAEPPVAVPPYVRLLHEEVITAEDGACPAAADAAAAGAAATTAPASSIPGGAGSCSADAAPRRRRLHLRVFTEAHCWAMLNITTARPIRRWSLPSPPVAAPLRQPIGGAASGFFHMVRFSHESESPFWELWVDVDVDVDAGAGAEGGEAGPGQGAGWASVELSATYLSLTRELVAMRDALPKWVLPTWIGTTYHAAYVY
ncbi:hypothetical protein HYH02_000347 [Chlamydomonas schloesseri]|uniref:Peptidase M28 domain-containing protein n=1 Tax=Chlamydomonas schloesseri TaxID=2026947 RepID=A0A835WY79_9CHLO|nr:hypothetical protein HYH02_000347 [Chlamydomonas schloesseri]|eukprot:KAG2454500.1 hypothetical protein HYH02_000347 [Chlamydomonas schloesseri]